MGEPLEDVLAEAKHASQFISEKLKYMDMVSLNSVVIGQVCVLNGTSDSEDSFNCDLFNEEELEQKLAKTPSGPTELWYLCGKVCLSFLFFFMF